MDLNPTNTYKHQYFKEKKDRRDSAFHSSLDFGNLAQNHGLKNSLKNPKTDYLTTAFLHSLKYRCESNQSQHTHNHNEKRMQLHNHTLSLNHSPTHNHNYHYKPTHSTKPTPHTQQLKQAKHTQPEDVLTTTNPNMHQNMLTKPHTNVPQMNHEPIEKIGTNYENPNRSLNYRVNTYTRVGTLLSPPTVSKQDIQLQGL